MNNSVMTDSKILQTPVDFVFMMECVNGCANASADGNGPRMDMETGYGVISDVCTKRKLRKFLAQYSGERLYIESDKSLNAKDAEIFEGAGVSAKESIRTNANDRALREWACKNFLDIRFFGAAITSFAGLGYSTSQTAGPVVISTGVSLDPISVVPMTITRQALTTEKEQESKRNTMGIKYVVPYAVYRIEGSIDVGRAEKNGFTENDAEMLYKAIIGMADIDISAARPVCSVRDLWVFEHSSKWRDIPRYKLMDAVSVSHADPNLTVPRKYSDYKIDLDTSAIPDSVTVRHF